MPAKIEITDKMISQIEQDYQQTPHGERRQLLEEYAETLGCSPSTLYRKIDTGTERTREADYQIPTKLIMKVAQEKVHSGLIGRQQRYLTTEDACRIVEEKEGLEQGTLNRSTVDARLRKLQFNQARTYQRYEEPYVNCVQQIDASVSEYFGIIEKQNGDYLIKVYGKTSANPYKNKPEESKLKLWLVSAKETYSRYTNMQYFASPGENHKMFADFCNYIWYRDDEQLPSMKLPDRIEIDQGPWAKDTDIKKQLWQQLAVEVRGKASKSEREEHHQSQGKVERQFRTHWQRFELKLARRLLANGCKQLTLNELNTFLQDHLMQQYQKAHPTRRQHSIMQVYEEGLQRRKILANKGEIEFGNRELDRDIYDILYKTITRVPDASGIISINNELYELEDKRFAGEKVKVMYDIDGNLKGQAADAVSKKPVSFAIKKFNPDEAPKKKTPETLKQRLAKTNGNGDYSRLGVVERNDKPQSLPANVKQLGDDSAKMKPDTAFSSTGSESQMGYDEAREYLCDQLGCTWADLPETVRWLFDQAHAHEKLTQSTLDELRSVVNH